jgi:DNA-binding transcriptional ArsR family regulator/TusA-related sulfurtransferase
MAASSVAPTAVPDGGADERAVRQALGVPTRAAIYRVLRTEGVAHSAREIGDRIGIHANVARAHLDVLVDAGLATAGSRHNPTGGRPAKVYVAREQHVASVRRVPTVPSGAVLGLQTALQLVAGLREHVARAELLAEDQGRRLVGAGGGRAASRTFDAALLVALDGLRAAFPGAHLRVDEDGARAIDGVRSELGAIGEVDAALADALAVGIVRGALAASGANADVEVADATVRARPAAGDGALPLPAASVDARRVAFDRGVVRAMQAIGRLRPGAHLEVLTDAEGAPAAFARWADRAGHRITAVDRIRDRDGRPAVRILIRRAAGR